MVVSVFVSTMHSDREPDFEMTTIDVLVVDDDDDDDAGIVADTVYI
jgi:hypothetical protein